MKRIALIGDYSESVVAHRAIPRALQLAVDRLRADVTWEWVHSSTLGEDPRDVIEPFAAAWCVPGSPYENTEGVIRTIHLARKTSRPFLGTCGGFQHALLEYAETEWNVASTHAEIDPQAEQPVIAPLMCALVEVKGALHFAPGSRLAKIYASDTATEEYHCSYGLNPLYADRLVDGPMKVSARDDAGSVRAIELDGHPFFIGTLFQPERAALRDVVPPLVKAFVAAVAA